MGVICCDESKTKAACVGHVLRSTCLSHFSALLEENKRRREQTRSKRSIKGRFLWYTSNLTACKWMKLHVERGERSQREVWAADTAVSLFISVWGYDTGAPCWNSVGGSKEIKHLIQSCEHSELLLWKKRLRRDTVKVNAASVSAVSAWAGSQTVRNHVFVRGSSTSTVGASKEKMHLHLLPT